MIHSPCFKQKNLSLIRQRVLDKLQCSNIEEVLAARLSTIPKIHTSRKNKASPAVSYPMTSTNAP